MQASKHVYHSVLHNVRTMCIKFAFIFVHTPVHTHEYVHVQVCMHNVHLHVLITCIVYMYVHVHVGVKHILHVDMHLCTCNTIIMQCILVVCV